MSWGTTEQGQNFETPAGQLVPHSQSSIEFLTYVLEMKYSICTSESRTVRDSNGHLSDTFWVRLLDTIWKPEKNNPEASLDHFGMNKIFFMTFSL
jgi:hypothetical protein